MEDHQINVYFTIILLPRPCNVNIMMVVEMLYSHKKINRVEGNPYFLESCRWQVALVRFGMFVLREKRKEA